MTEKLHIGGDLKVHVGVSRNSIKGFDYEIRNA